MRRMRSLLVIVVSSGCLIAVGALAAPSAAAPGTPGVMARPTLVLYEGFENAVPPATADFVQTLADYEDGVNAPVAGYVGVPDQTYSADPAWNGQFCNGLIVAGQDVGTVPTATQAAACLQAGWNQSRDLAETLGLWRDDADYPYPALPGPAPLANHAVTAYTQGDSPAGVMATTVVTAIPGHYYSASVDVAQANCWATNPVDLALSLDDGVTGPVSVFPGPISACALPVHQINGDNVGTFVGLDSLLARSPDLRLSLVNNLGGGGGDDNAFDNLAVIDTTPQLDAVIAAGPQNGAYAANQPARLTFTVTNTHLAGFPEIPGGPKSGWSLALALPAGLVAAAEPNAQTDCANGSIEASGTAVNGGGDLLATDVSCTLSLDVTSAGGDYTLDPATFELVGLLAPAATTASFVADPVPPSPAGLPATGAGLHPALPIGALTLALGALLVLASARHRRAASAD